MSSKQAMRILDHGSIRLVEAWGHGDAGNGYSDGDTDYECGIIEAARQSTQASFRGWVRRVRCPKCGREWECETKPAYCTAGACCDGGGVLTEEVHTGDQKLLAFLYTGKPQHATPFEFAGCIIEVQAPIFVFREWHRHRTQSYNEMSARYAPLPDLNYVPDWEVLKQRGEAATKNRQAAGTEPWNEEMSKAWHGRLPEVYEYLQKVYTDGLMAGVPKELARIVLPVGRYSKMRASANLRNWLAFMTLRSDPQAQYEIRQYANALGVILAECFPRTFKLFQIAREAATLRA
jgi:thymidylate synthase (FAD)